jgi:hypothetical protein
MEVTEEWRQLYVKELHNLYSSPEIIMRMKSGRMRCVVHVSPMAEILNAYRILVRKTEVNMPLWRSGLGGRIILSRVGGSYVTYKTGFGLDDWIY